MRQGRRAEFKDAFARLGDQIPDPLDERTFRAAKLDWNERTGEAGRKRLALVRDLLTVRRDKIVPLLAGIGFDPSSTRHDGTLLRAGWTHRHGRLRLLANVSDGTARRPPDWRNGDPIWGGAPDAALPPCSVFWSIGAP